MLRSLRALRHKYLILAHLRQEREAAESQGILRFHGAQGAARRQRTRALAQAFPGALRELEGFDARTFFQRAGEVQAEWATVRHGQGAAPRRVWVRLVLDFHATIVEVQRIRQWWRARGEAADVFQAELPISAHLAAFRHWYATLPERCHPTHVVDAAFLRRYLRRPDGSRLMELVWDDLAQRHGLPVGTVRRAVLGPRGMV